jgi:TolB-like protein/class 3 adenylate cyclase/Flp pilus assembly protein TadD
MAEGRVQRRLAAILVADVAGYSGLVRDAEERTLAAVGSQIAEIFRPHIAARGGRVFKTTGDGLLAEFTSVVDAVRAAVDIQRALRSRAASRPEERGIAFRIGINLGDVVVEGDDLYGDGVNVAARLEGLAEPGGIAVSGTAFDHVQHNVEAGFAYLGERRLKNIADPVRVYRVLAGPGEAGTLTDESRRPAASRRWRAAAAAVALIAVATGAILWPGPFSADTEVAAPERMAFPLPDRPSIAVLPFTDLEVAGGQGRLGDGLAESITASLSKVSGIFVIAPGTTVTYRDRAVTASRVAEQLGVRYVLDGSVQRAGPKVRITARLVDALSGRHVWSGRYDREITDLFAFQDDITLNVVTALQVTLTDGEMVQVRRRGTDNLEAWLLVTQSLELMMRFTREDNARARQAAERAVALDATYPDAYVRLARTHLLDYQTGWAENRAESLRRCVELVHKAVTLDPSYPDAYILLGTIHLFLGQHADATAYAEKAVAISPSHSLAIATLAMVRNYAGQPQEAIPLLHKAMRLSPYYPDWFLGELGRAYFQSGQLDAAIRSLNQRLVRSPNNGEALVLLAASLSAAGREAEARAALARFIEPRPAYTVRDYAAGEFYRDRVDLERVLAALRRAGLPE